MTVRVSVHLSVFLYRVAKSLSLSLRSGPRGPGSGISRVLGEGLSISMPDPANSAGCWDVHGVMQLATPASRTLGIDGAHCPLGRPGRLQVPISCRGAMSTCRQGEGRTAFVPPTHGGRVTAAESPRAPLPSWPQAARARTTSGAGDAPGGASIPELGSLDRWVRTSEPRPPRSGLAWACGVLPRQLGVHTQHPAIGLEPSFLNRALNPHPNPFLRF